MDYLGSKGNHLIDGENSYYDAIPPQYQSPGTGLNAQVPNPFNGIIQSPTSAVLQQGYGAAKYVVSPLTRNIRESTTIANRVRNSTYHAGVFKAQKRFSHGLSFLASYTGGKILDDASTTVTFIGASSSSPKQDPWNNHLEKSVSTQDESRILEVSSIYELPVGKNKPYLGSAPKALDFIVGGWQVSGIYGYHTGFPLQLSNGGNTTGLGGGTIRPNNNGQDAKIGAAVGNRINEYFNTADFSQVAELYFWYRLAHIARLARSVVAHVGFLVLQVFPVP